MKTQSYIVAIIMLLVGSAQAQEWFTPEEATQHHAVSKEFATAAIKYIAAIKWASSPSDAQNAKESPMELAAHINAEAAITTETEQKVLQQIGKWQIWVQLRNLSGERSRECVRDWRNNLLQQDGAMPASCALGSK
jgi:hypothetical protein